MNELEFDSSKNNYIKNMTSETYYKLLEWEMAIGLQEVDNLKPSEYFKNIIEDNLNSDKTVYEIELDLKNYYDKKNKENDLNFKEFECDLVSTRIVQLLQYNKFELSISFLKYIHEYLFKDIYSFSGNFRKHNFSKHEIILNGDSASYGDYKLINDSLEYDLTLEKEKNYQKMNIVEIINSISDFTSKIWQVHPFAEGNTRTTVVFIIKYLKKLGFNVDNTLFKDKSIYFRNALVRSNYFNKELNIKPTEEYLIKFYENLLLSKKNNLSSRDLIIGK